MYYSFVIPSNRPYHAIELLLLSIRDQTQTAKEIIIVRDYTSSIDEWRDYQSQIVKLFDQTDISVTIINIHNDSNFHVGKGASYVRNYGRKEVKTPYMIFVDDDNTFAKDFAEKLATQRKKHPDAIIVPTQYQWQSDEIRANVVADGFSYWMCRPKRITTEEIERMKKWKNERLLSDSNSLSLNPSISHSLILITLASSNCLSWPTKIFSQYPFDESIPFIYEDMIMTWQMSTHGVELFLDTDIPIYHHHGMRSRAANLYIDTPRKAYYKGKHRILLIHTLGNIRQKILFWTIGIRGHTTWLAVVIVFSCPIHIWWWCISSVIKGTRDGIQTVRK